MNLEQCLEGLTAIGLNGKVQQTGHPDYIRVFCMQGNTSYGRMVIHKGAYSHIKWYWVQEGELGEADTFIMRWDYWVQTGKVLTQQQYNEAYFKAKELREKDFEERLQWRRDNPFKSDGVTPAKRKPLARKNIRRFMVFS